jgi:cyclopropane fatty-acyl-phospholipid synthase-like methyltransferase
MSTNPYETYAQDFIRHRGGQPKGIGQKTVRIWAAQLPPNANVLDLGCGTGWPISLALTEAGLTLYGLELSSTLFTAFQQNFPQAHSRCEDIRSSDFFAQQFEGIVALGVLFLFTPHEQQALIQKIAQHLQHKGQFLFTAPAQKHRWADVMTGQALESLGKKAYLALFKKFGLQLLHLGIDEGGNHYYQGVKL